MNEEERKTNSYASDRDNLSKVGGQMPASARCPACYSAEISVLRSFSVGSGSVHRTLTDDVYCRYCGHIGQPVYELADDAILPSATEPGKRQIP